VRDTFVGYFKPSETDLQSLWEEAIFVFDANVLLNLYRYSTETCEELKKAIEYKKDRIFVPYQAAKEFLKNRRSVNDSQIKEYEKTIKDISDLRQILLNKDRHPFLPEDQIEPFETYISKLTEVLDKQKKDLLDSTSDDNILEYVGDLFQGRIGKIFCEDELKKIEEEGCTRYDNKVPPGYKDNNKDPSDDIYRKYGDFIIWKEVLNLSKEKQRPIIFITDDKKDDWWLIQSGKTISPRPELIAELYQYSENKFWMYDVERFVQFSAKETQTIISELVIDELRKISETIQETTDSKGIDVQRNIDTQRHIIVNQEETTNDDVKKEGFLTITLDKEMKNATGSGKFRPSYNFPPVVNVGLISSPYEDVSEFKINYGCGTGFDFHIHIKAYTGQLLKSGEYVFKYSAFTF
jgi:predicted nucleic acid-binding protein